MKKNYQKLKPQTKLRCLTSFVCARFDHSVKLPCIFPFLRCCFDTSSTTKENKQTHVSYIDREKLNL